MSSDNDELEALFEAQSLQYRQPAGHAPLAAAPAALAEHTGDRLAPYYETVLGLYLREPPGTPAHGKDGQGDAPDHAMFDRLGGIVRQLHDSMRELGYDKTLVETTSQIVDAKDRLEHIAALTEQSAVKVLTTLETGMPAQDELIKQGREMEQRWALLFAGKIGIDDFKILAADAQAFAAHVTRQAEQEKARLLDIMMAQDFQDLTGQIIKKVVGVTTEVEQELAQLLLDNAPAAVKQKHVELMNGPAAPGVALAQGDVDDLLGDLGF